MTKIRKAKGNRSKLGIREYYEQLYAHKLDNLYELDKFPERHKLSELTQEK